MAFDQPPVWLENSNQHHALDYRLMLSSLVSKGGVAKPGDLMVEPLEGTPSMAIKITPGGVFIPSTRGSSQGVYHAYNRDQIVLELDPPDSPRPRIDVVVVRVNDSAQDVALEDDVQVEVITGIPDNPPQPPSIPFEDYVQLAEITVLNGSSSVNPQLIIPAPVFSMSAGVSWENFTPNFINVSIGSTGRQYGYYTRRGSLVEFEAGFKIGLSGKVNGNIALEGPFRLAVSSGWQFYGGVIRAYARKLSGSGQRGYGGFGISGGSGASNLWVSEIYGGELIGQWKDSIPFTWDLGDEFHVSGTLRLWTSRE